MYSMGRHKKTRQQYITEYWMVLSEIAANTPLRKISKKYGVGLSTCMRLKKKFFLKKWPFNIL